MTALRDVAIVTFHFPPQGGAGSLRLLSFARHLPEYGWRPRVITVGDLGGSLSDSTLVRRIPSSADVERWFTPLGAWPYRKRGLVRQVLEWASAYPDPAIGWSLASGWRLGRQFREHPPSIMMTSSPPHSLHAAGWIAAAMGDVPWVIDLRDPWLSHSSSGLSRLRNMAGSFLEDVAVREARCVLANTSRLAQALRARRRPPRRVEVLTNGYDDEEIAATRRSERTTPRDSDFMIVHAGALYSGHRDPLDFLEALASARMRAQSPRRIRFVIAGDSSFHRNPVLAERIRQLGMESAVESPGYVPHDQVLEMMASADLLLLIQGAAFHLQVPSKAYEYLALGRPVLALTGEGATADLVRSCPWGTVISPGRQDDVVKFLAAQMARTAVAIEGASIPPTVPSRREIAARLAAILDELTLSTRVY